MGAENNISQEVYKTFNVRIQNARDEELNAVRNNPVLLDGEIFIVRGVDNKTGQIGIKIGDGVTPFNELPYYTDPTLVDEALKGVPNGIATLDENGKIPREQLPPMYDEGFDVEITPVPYQLGILPFNGEVQMPFFRNYDPHRMIAGGTIEARDAGAYTAIFTLIAGFVWPDGSTDPVIVPWEVTPAVVKVPTCTSSLIYTGSAQMPTWNSVEGLIATANGTTSATNAGDYYVEYIPDDNHTWEDGTRTPKRASWSIARAVIPVPVCTSGLVYNGSSQSPTWNSTAYTTKTANSTNSATNAGTYYIEFQPDSNHMWPDGTTGVKRLAWPIAKATGVLGVSVNSLELI